MKQILILFNSFKMKLFSSILFILFLQIFQSKAQFFYEQDQISPVVRIVNNAGNNSCIGTLITAEWVLTSSVCALKGIYEETRILYSTSDSFDMAGQIQNIFIHPEFFAQNRSNDIALIQLATPADLSVRVMKIPKSVISFEAQKARVVRWFNTMWYNESGSSDGLIISGYVDIRDVVILSNDLCSRYPVLLNDNRLCSFINAAAEGNEGAPLIIENQVIGLVSVSAVQIAVSGLKNPDDYCNNNNNNNNLFPVTTYTSTANYREWIKQITRLNIL